MGFCVGPVGEDSSRRCVKRADAPISRRKVERRAGAISIALPAAGETKETSISAFVSESCLAGIEPRGREVSVLAQSIILTPPMAILEILEGKL